MALLEKEHAAADGAKEKLVASHRFEMDILQKAYDALKAEREMDLVERCMAEERHKEYQREAEATIEQLRRRLSDAQRVMLPQRDSSFVRRFR